MGKKHPRQWQNVARIRNYVCMEGNCGKSFTSKSALNRHKRCHLMEEDSTKKEETFQRHEHLEDSIDYTRHSDYCKKVDDNLKYDDHSLSHVMTPTLSHVMTPTLSHVMTPTLSHVMTPTLSHVMTPTLSHVMTPFLYMNCGQRFNNESELCGNCQNNFHESQYEELISEIEVHEENEETIIKEELEIKQENEEMKKECEEIQIKQEHEHTEYAEDNETAFGEFENVHTVKTEPACNDDNKDGQTVSISGSVVLPHPSTESHILSENVVKDDTHCDADSEDRATLPMLSINESVTGPPVSENTVKVEPDCHADNEDSQTLSLNESFTKPLAASESHFLLDNAVKDEHDSDINSSKGSRGCGIVSVVDDDECYEAENQKRFQNDSTVLDSDGSVKIYPSTVTTLLTQKVPCGKLQFTPSQSTSSHLSSPISGTPTTIVVKTSVDAKLTTSVTPKSFACGICSKVFRRKDHMKTHELIHQDTERLPCSFCHKDFKYKRNLIEHELTHIGKVKYLCFTCGKGFQKHSLLIMHENIHAKEPVHRPDQNAEIFECRICLKILKSKSCLRSHISRHTTTQRYTCPLCKKVFKHKGSLRVHENTHAGVFRYTCSTCGRGFQNRSDFLGHENSHKEVVPKKRSFEVKKVKVHHPVYCGICFKKFKKRAYMKRHERSHTKTERFPCSICDKVFKHKGSRRVHEDTHAGKFKFSCTTCGKGFQNRGCLIRHGKSHTKNIMRKTDLMVDTNTS